MISGVDIGEKGGGRSVVKGEWALCGNAGAGIILSRHYGGRYEYSEFLLSFSLSISQSFFFFFLLGVGEGGEGGITTELSTKVPTAPLCAARAVRSQNDA